MGPTFVDFSASSTYTVSHTRKVNKDTPFWLRPTALSLEPFVVTDHIEAEKEILRGAHERLREAQILRPGANLVYVAFAANQYGIGRGSRQLVSALALRMKSYNSKRNRSQINPFKEARILDSSPPQFREQQQIQSTVVCPTLSTALDLSEDFQASTSDIDHFIPSFFRAHQEECKSGWTPNELASGTLSHPGYTHSSRRQEQPTGSHGL